MFRRPLLRLVNALRGRPVTSMVVMALLGAVLAATAIAATTGASGGPVTAVKVPRSTDFNDTTSTTYTDLPGASTTITMPTGQRAIIFARFSTTSDCRPQGTLATASPGF